MLTNVRMHTNFPEPKYFLCYLTSCVARKMTAHYDRVLSPLGLTARQMIALDSLCCSEGVSLGVFAERAGIGKAAATGMIKRLESRGLVKSRPDPKDGRLNTLSLTPLGQKLAPQVAAQVSQLEKRMEEAIGQEKLKTIVQGLHTILNLDLEE
ncbi:MarR family winged helix-turn-helix transcriptional regulator [Dethiosulfatarculus sandiegensis]|nr:MarR family transcriptional regulator [Dethiosulfatarculus sandiegensis]